MLEKYLTQHYHSYWHECEMKTMGQINLNNLETRDRKRNNESDKNNEILGIPRILPVHFNASR
jgi:hypothetical protein